MYHQSSGENLQQAARLRNILLEIIRDFNSRTSPTEAYPQSASLTAPLLKEPLSGRGKTQAKGSSETEQAISFQPCELGIKADIESSDSSEERDSLFPARLGVF